MAQFGQLQTTARLACDALPEIQGGHPMQVLLVKHGTALLIFVAEELPEAIPPPKLAA